MVEFGGGVVVEWWLSKIKKVKEKRYLKINSPMNHMKPTRQEVGANYNKDLPKYLD